MEDQYLPLKIPPQSQPTSSHPRSIDDFLESAYRHQDEFPSATQNGHRETLKSFSIQLQRWRYYIIFLALGIANSGDSAELGCTNYILSSVNFQHDILQAGGGAGGEDVSVDFAGRGAAIASAHFLGMLISGLLSGILADIWGRRSTLLLGLLCNAITGSLAALVRNATELCILRFLCGIGLGMVIAGVVTLSAEISPPSRRGRFMTLVASCYTLGFLYTSFWALIIFRVSGSGSWRLFLFMNALPTIIAASLVIAFVPESPRFYLCRGRLKEAVHISNLLGSRMNYGGNGNALLTEDELTQYLYQAKHIGEGSIRAKEALKLNDITDNETKVQSAWEEVWESLKGIGQVFANGMHRITIPLQLTYCSLTLVTGVATWWTKIFQSLDLQTDAYALSFYHTLAQIPGMMLASGLIDKVGRRRLVIIGFGGGFVSLSLLSMTANIIHSSGNEKAGGEYSFYVLGLACFYSIFLCIGWLSIECLSAESFPTKVRSTGRGVCVASGRVVGFLVQFLYGSLVNQNRISYMLGVAGVLAVVGIFVSIKTTDTTNIDLQDHWEYSEGEKSKDEPVDGSVRRISSPDSMHQE